jgi:hypothetical protein
MADIAVHRILLSPGNDGAGRRASMAGRSFHGAGHQQKNPALFRARGFLLPNMAWR